MQLYTGTPTGRVTVTSPRSYKCTVECSDSKPGAALVNTGGSQLVPENDCGRDGRPSLPQPSATSEAPPESFDEDNTHAVLIISAVSRVPASLCCFCSSLTLCVCTHRSQRVSLAQSFVAADRGTARPHLELTTTGRRRRTGHSSACYGLEHVAQLVSFPAAMRARVKVGPGAAVTRVQ